MLNQQSYTDVGKSLMYYVIYIYIMTATYDIVMK